MTEPIVPAADRNRRWVPWVIQGAIALFVFLHLRPDLLFTDTQPIGADFVVHNAAIQLIDHHLWDHGLLSGWSWWWSAGFPAFRFYMPLPLLAGWVVGWFVPTAIALKIMAVTPLVAMPWAVGRLVRTTGLGLSAQTLSSIATVLFIFESHQHVFGGNVASTLIGEYPYEWGMLFALMAMTAFWRDLEEGRRGARTGGLLALAALFHPIGALAALIGCTAIACARPRAQWRRTIRHGGRSVALAAALSAFWYVPFLWYGQYAITTTFERRTDFAAMLLPYSSHTEVVLWVLGGLGVVEVVRRRTPLLFALTALWGATTLAVYLLPKGGVANSRLVPYAVLMRMLFVGLGAALVCSVIVTLLRRWRPSAGELGPLVVAGLAVLIAVSFNLGTLPFGHRTTEKLGSISVTKEYRWLVGPTQKLGPWSQYPSVALAGLEAIPKYPELQQLVDDLAKVKKKYGCGRIAYEFDKDGVFGSPYVFQLIPSLTHGCFTVVNGLISGSPTSDLQFIGETAWSYAGERYFTGLPYGTLDMKKALGYFHELGVRYYLAFSPFAVLAAQATPQLSKIATSGSTYIYGIDDAAVVQPLSTMPIVDTHLDNREAWTSATHDWYTLADPAAQRFATAGPADWPRGAWSATTATSASAATSAAADVKIANFAGGNDWLAFDVSKPGVPILVRATYFPTWSVTGATGPYRVSPGWMVVVPTGTHVRLDNNADFMEVAPSIVTLIAVGGVIWLAVRTRRERRRAA